MFQQNNQAVKPLSEEWFILKFLKRWIADDIRIAIKKDVDLAELFLNNPLESAPFRAMANRNKDLVSSGNVGDVLYWFSVRRPDLYNVIVESEDGINWLTKNAENLKKILT